MDKQWKKKKDWKEEWGSYSQWRPDIPEKEELGRFDE